MTSVDVDGTSRTAARTLGEVAPQPPRVSPVGGEGPTTPARWPGYLAHSRNDLRLPRGDPLAAVRPQERHGVRDDTRVFQRDAVTVRRVLLRLGPAETLHPVFYQSATSSRTSSGSRNFRKPTRLCSAVVGPGIPPFLIVRRLFPTLPLLAYAAGALVIVHASDHALNWVGQLNQFGVMFWTLLAVYLLVVALQQASTKWSASSSPRRRSRRTFASGATRARSSSSSSRHFSFFRSSASHGGTGTVGAFYVVPLVFVLRNLQRYVGDDGATYQERSSGTTSRRRISSATSPTTSEGASSSGGGTTVCQLSTVRAVRCSPGQLRPRPLHLDR